MDFRVYDILLDPVLVVPRSGIIKYINPAAVRWLAVSADLGIIGKNFADFVIFKGAEVMNAMSKLAPYQSSPYQLSHFVLPSRSFEGMAKVSVMCLPGTSDEPLFAVVIRDRGFINTLMDEDEILLPTLPKDPTTENNEDQMPEGYNPNAQASSKVLDEVTITKALPHERTAKFISAINMVFLEIKKGVVGKSVLITDDWIEVIVKPDSTLKEGMRVNLDVAGNANVRAFAATGVVLRIKPYDADQQMRLQFTGLSPMSRKALGDFLSVHALRI